MLNMYQKKKCNYIKFEWEYFWGFGTTSFFGSFGSGLKQKLLRIQNDYLFSFLRQIFENLNY